MSTPSTRTRINAIRHAQMTTRIAPDHVFSDFASVLPHDQWPSQCQLAETYGNLATIQWHQSRQEWTASTLTVAGDRMHPRAVPDLRDINPRQAVTIIFGRQLNHYCGLAPLGWEKAETEQAMGPGPGQDDFQ